MIDKNEFLIFNIPASVKQEDIRDLVTQKGIQVLKIQLKKALDEKSNAFAYVKLGTPNQVKIIKDKLRNHWIEDKKLKLKTHDELLLEHVDNRTIIA